MDCIIWTRVSSQSQDNQRQILNLKQLAAEKGWTVRRIFTETISGNISTHERREFGKMLEYAQTRGIKLIMISEISRIGRRVIDVLNAIDSIHSKGIGLYIQQFNMISFENGKENPMVMLLLQVMSIGAEMENNHRKTRQSEGIKLARIQHPEKYAGRKAGSRGNNEKQLKKYADVVDLLKKSKLSIRKIAKYTSRSINTVRMVRNLLAA